MKICLENVNLSSPSGPNSFANKLVKHTTNLGHEITDYGNSDVRLCFIETRRGKCEKPLFQRLDGIYFNIKQNYNLQNANIKKTYDISDGIVFQSNFSKRLITHWFGEHDNTTIIHNGADIEKIDSIDPIRNSVIDKFDNVWSCASHWRPHKRLSENIRYFLEHAKENDCLIVAGQPENMINHDRIFYTGNLDHNTLIAVYKRSVNFIHLGRFDNCPNVVIDARAAGCHIICSDSGGTPEIAGADATVIQDEEWDYQPLDLYNPPKLDFTKKVDNLWNTDIDMKKVAQRYMDFLIKEV